MSNPYLKAQARKIQLQSASLEDYDFNKSLKIKHKDGSEFLWNGCYFEYQIYDNVKFVIIAPEHHPAVYYEVDDVIYLEAIS